MNVRTKRMFCLPKTALAIGAALVLATMQPALSPCLGAEMKLVTEGKDPCPIYTPANVTADEKAAAAELAAYLTKISGGAFAVGAAPTPLPERGVFVGRFDEGRPAAGLGNDAFCIHVQGQRAFVVGGNGQGTFYGVYALLEQIGCRWWTYDDEDVPSLKTIALPEANTTVHPAFSMHNVWNNEAQCKLRRFNLKSRSTSWEAFSGGHTIIPLLKDFAAAHPEAYPMPNAKTGQRKPNKTHYCYSTPGIAEALADAIEEQIKQRRGDITTIIYHAGMGDTGDGMCKCPACAAVYKEETWTDPDGVKKIAYTATLLRMINKTAEILAKKHPGIRIGTFAYMSLEAPPANTVPRENVFIRVPRLRHCTVHAVGTCDTNKSYLRNLERWCQIAPGRVYIWEYGACFPNFVSPYPCLYSMAGNLKLYCKMGIKGVEIQGNYSSMGGDLAALKNYVWGKVFWNPDIDPKAVLRQFCDGYYGPAADRMYAYVERLEKVVTEPNNRICANEFASGGGILAKSKDAKADLRKLADDALAAVAGKAPFERRVHESMVSLDMLDLARPGQLVEQGDKLVRKNGEYTYARAQEAVKYLRGAALNEWSSGRAAQMAMVASNGGPLVTLTRGELTVKVAPALNGQIRQISYRGKDLLRVENDPGAKRYPMVGSAMESVNTRMMTQAGTPTATKVEMDGDGGVSLWGGATKFFAHKVVELADDGGLTSTATIRLPDKSRGEGNMVSASTETVWAVGDAAKVTIEYLDKENHWQPVSLSSDANQAVVPQTAALRLTMPEQRCVVIDRYLDPGVGRCLISTSAKTGTMTINVRLAGVAPAADKPRIVLKRRIEVALAPDAK